MMTILTAENISGSIHILPYTDSVSGTTKLIQSSRLTVNPLLSYSVHVLTPGIGCIRWSRKIFSCASLKPFSYPVLSYISQKMAISSSESNTSFKLHFHLRTHARSRALTHSLTHSLVHYRNHARTRSRMHYRNRARTQDLACDALACGRQMLSRIT